MSTANNLLIDSKQILIVQTELATLLGVSQAVAVQQIHFWSCINEQMGKKQHFFDDRWWVYNTWKEWQENNFPFWDIRTIRRVFESLEEDAIIVTRPHKNNRNGKWVCVNQEQLRLYAQDKGVSLKMKRAERRRVDKMSTHGGQNVHPTGNTETTQRLKDSVTPENGVTAPDEKPTDSALRDEGEGESASKPRNVWYDTVSEVWGYSGSLNGEMQKMLQGKSKRAQFKDGNITPGMSPEEVLAWAKWYRLSELNGNDNLNMLEDRMKIQSSVMKWREMGRPSEVSKPERDLFASNYVSDDEDNDAESPSAFIARMRQHTPNWGM